MWSGGGCQTDTGRPDSGDEGRGGEHRALWTPAMVTSDGWVWVPGSIWGSETTQLLQGSGLTEGSALRKVLTLF